MSFLSPRIVQYVPHVPFFSLICSLLNMISNKQILFCQSSATKWQQSQQLYICFHLCDVSRRKVYLWTFLRISFFGAIWKFNFNTRRILYTFLWKNNVIPVLKCSFFPSSIRFFLVWHNFVTGFCLYICGDSDARKRGKHKNGFKIDPTRHSVFPRQTDFLLFERKL